MTIEAQEAPALGHNRPKARVKLYWHTCPECGEPFKGKVDATFCSVEHKNTFHNRSAKRGKIMVPLTLAWRGGRGSKGNAKWAMRQMAALADQWNREDREAGRMSMDEYLNKKVNQGWSPADL